MAKNKTHINFIFALLSAGLLIATILAAVRHEGLPILPSTVNTPAAGTLPENHPSVDMAQKLAQLIRMGEENPQNADIQTQIGNIYYDMGEYNQAVISYRRSLGIKPDQASVETDLATSFHYLGKHDEALKHFDHVLTYSPGFTQAMFNKGVVLIHGKNDPEGGLRTWEELLKTDLDPARRAEIEKSVQQLKSSIR